MLSCNDDEAYYAACIGGNLDIIRMFYSLPEEHLPSRLTLKRTKTSRLFAFERAKLARPQETAACTVQ